MLREKGYILRKRTEYDFCSLLDGTAENRAVKSVTIANNFSWVYVGLL